MLFCKEPGQTGEYTTYGYIAIIFEEYNKCSLLQNIKNVRDS